jgi:hypothetical protein
MTCSLNGKGAKAYIRSAEEQGYEIVSITVNKSLKIKFRCQDGFEFKYSAPMSPSDYRAFKNWCADLKHIERRARELCHES